MKKFAKICLITTGVMILAGAILLGSSLAMDSSAASGAMSEVEKGNLFSGFFSFFRSDNDWDDLDEEDDWDDDHNLDDEDDWDDDHDLDDEDDWDDGHRSESYSNTMEENKPYYYDYSSLSSLVIDLNAAELVLESSSEIDRLCFLAEYKSTSDTVLLTDNGKDSIMLSSENHRIVGDPTVKLTIQVPENYSIDELEIELAAGTIHASATLTVKETEFSVNAGMLAISNITASEMDIENDAGDIEVTLPGSETDYNYELSCSLGRIEFAGKSKNGIDKSYVKNNHSNRDVSIECDAGNISVNFQ